MIRVYDSPLFEGCHETWQEQMIQYNYQGYYEIDNWDDDDDNFWEDSDYE